MLSVTSAWLTKNPLLSPHQLTQSCISLSNKDRLNQLAQPPKQYFLATQDLKQVILLIGSAALLLEKQ